MKKPEKDVTASTEAVQEVAAAAPEVESAPANKSAEAIGPDETIAEKVIDSTESMTMDEVERLVSEAEQRGYLRGRNETIEAEVMPAPAPSSAYDSTVGESCPSFLAHLRPGFWD